MTRSIRFVLIAYVLMPALLLALLPWRWNPGGSLVMSGLLVVPIQIARGLRRMEKAAFWALFAHAASLPVLGCFMAILAPPVAPVTFATAACCALVAGFFAHPDHRKPFLDESPRGFRASPRLPVSVQAKARLDDDVFEGCTLDLSRGGAYIAVNGHRLPAFGKRIAIELAGADESLRCFARVAGVFPRGREPYPAGFSVEFARLTRRDMRTIEHFFAHAKRTRQLIEVPIEVRRGEQVYRTSTRELATEGCSLSRPLEALQAGDRVIVKLRLPFQNPVECAAEVMWAQQELRFDALTSADVAAIRRAAEASPSRLPLRAGAL